LEKSDRTVFKTRTVAHLQTTLVLYHTKR